MITMLSRSGSGCLIRLSINGREGLVKLSDKKLSFVQWLLVDNGKPIQVIKSSYHS